MRKVLSYKASFIVALVIININKVFSTKCAVLNQEKCELEVNFCVWYKSAGCREKCNFNSENGCNLFVQDECEWDNDIGVCEVTQSVSGPKSHEPSTSGPTVKPTAEPTVSPSKEPTSKPTIKLTSSPTEFPTKKPTSKPTFEPTPKPTGEPTAFPLKSPVSQPIKNPTTTPTSFPTKRPSGNPTVAPTSFPSKTPIAQPTRDPTTAPTSFPTRTPTGFPSYSPVINSVSTGVVVYVRSDKSSSLTDEVIVNSLKDVLQSYRITDNLAHMFEVITEECPMRHSPLEEQNMGELCRRFIPFLNINPYYSSNDAEVVMSIELTGYQFDDPTQLGNIQNELQDLYFQNDIELLDFHVLLNYGKDETKPTNVVMMLADDLGWGDVGYQACDRSTLEGGYETLCAPKNITPNIDEMAFSDSSVRLTRFYTAPQCGPSRASFLTGRQPIRECMLFNVFRAVPDGEIHQMSPIKCVQTAAEMFQQKYPNANTFHGGKWHLSKLKKDEIDEPNYTVSLPSENGFNTWIGTARHGPTLNFNCGCFEDTARDLCEMGIYNTTYFWESLKVNDEARKYSDQNDPKRFSCDEYFGNNYNSLRFEEEDEEETVGTWDTPIEKDDSEFLVDRFEEFLDSRDKKEPFFSLIWFHSPHAPVIASVEYFEKALALVVQNEPDPYNFDCGIIFSETMSSISPQDTCKDLTKNLEKDMNCSEVCKMTKAHYYGSIMALDDQVGRVRKLLNDKSLTQNTIVIFSSDNGPARYDVSSSRRYLSPGSVGNLDFWKFSPLEGGARVPFVIEYPNLITKNAEIVVPTSSYDFIPTVLELVGVEYSQNKVLDGVSLVPQIAQTQTTETDIQPQLLKRNKPIVLVTVRMEKHYIGNDMSIAILEGQSKYRQYGFDDSLNKMVEENKEGDRNLRDSKFEELVDGYENWISTIFDVSPCQDTATFLKRDDFCDRRTIE